MVPYLLSSFPPQALHELLSRCLPKFFETIEEDQDRHVVMTTLETLKDMVSVIQTPLLDNGVLDRIIKCLLDVLQVGKWNRVMPFLYEP